VDSKFTDKKNLIAFFFVAGVSCLFVALIVFLNLQEKKTIKIVNSHSLITANISHNFSKNHLGFDIREYLERNNIKKIFFNITESPTSSVIMTNEFGGEKKPYMGYGVKQEENFLYIDLYIDRETLLIINKSEEELAFDLTSQAFMAIYDLLERQEFPNRTFKEISAGTLQRLRNSAEQTQLLKNKGGLIFEVSIRR